MAAESASKTCVVCGQDVAGKPRVKDAAGRYMCAGACHEKAAAAAKQRAGGGTPAPPPKAPPVARPMGDGNVLGGLIAASPMLNSAMCTECGNPMPGGAVLCTRCGFNTQTGKSLRTAVIRDKQAKEPKAASGKYHNKYASGEAGPSFWKLLLVETLILSAVACLPLVGAEGFLVSLIVLAVASLIAWIGGTVAAFKNGQTIWGVCGVCMIVPLVNFVAGLGFLVFNLLFNEDKYSRSLYLATFIASFVFGAAIGIAIATGQTFDLFGRTLGG
ncbi:MAG TPA: hypothetical protein PKE29_09910 [Phycisphaerales bacterium]|nr:hypothetical protein [Phycisphaerales bacterium]